MTTKNQNLFDLIDTFDNVARIAALRSIAHSAMAKCIGAIRQHIRNRQRLERSAEDPQTALDQRNEFDEAARRNTEDAYHAEFGSTFTPPPSPLYEASILHAVYDWAVFELNKIITSKWDAPLMIEQMLEFMLKNTQKLDPSVAKALADVIKTDIKTIERMHELQSQREQEQLAEAIPEIVQIFNGFDDNGYAEAIDELPVLLQHQMGVKIVEALNKARNQALMRVLRTRRIADLADVPILEDAAKQVSNWVEQFEKTHKSAIREAIDAGKSIRTLEDVATL